MISLDSLFIFGIASLASLANVLLDYWMVHRREDYQDVKRSIAQDEDRLKKAKLEDTANPKTAKKIAEIEKRMSEDKRKLATMGWKSALLTPVLLMSVMTWMNGLFEGAVVATLPFEPFSFFRGITHRGLEGTNWYECSATYMYLLCALTVRPIIQRLMGVESASSAMGNPFLK